MRIRFLTFIGAILLVVVLHGGAMSQPTSSPVFVFVPFDNNTDFEGKWNIGVDVSRLLAGYVKARYALPTVSPVVVLEYINQENLLPDVAGHASFWRQLYGKFGARYLVTGSIDAFNVSKFITNASNVGGYEAFKGDVAITYLVYDLEWISRNAGAVELFKGTANGEFADRALALTLWGKETKRTIEFRDLDKIPFGSEDFNRTVIGQASLQMAENFALGLEGKLPLLKSKGLHDATSTDLTGEIRDSSEVFFKGHLVTGSVVFIEGEEAFVTLGSEDGIRKGAQMSGKEGTPSSDQITQAKTIKVLLEVVEVRGPHLSLCRIVSGKDLLRAKDKVQARVIE